MEKLSVITDSLSPDLARAVAIAAAAGLKYIELQSVWGKPLSELTDEEVSDVKQICARSGVSVCCLSQKNMFGAIPVGTTEIGDAIYRKHVEAMNRIIAIGRQLDCGLLRIMCFRKEMVLFGSGGAENAVVTKGAWEKFIELITPPVRIAEQEGVRLAIENSTKGMITSAWLARKLIDEIDSPALRMLWDPCNAFYFAEPPLPDGYDCLRGGYLAHLHIKDGRADIAKARIDFTPLGEGQMGPFLEKLAANLAKDGYDGFVSMESLYRPENGSAEEGFHASVGVARRLFG